MSNIFLFTGEESFLLRLCVNRWKQEFKRKYGDLNSSYLDIDNVSVKTIIAECKTIPFLASKRLVFVDGLPYSATKKAKKSELDIENLILMLDNIPDTTVLVFINQIPDKRTALYKKIKKNGEIKTFSPITGSKLYEWIEKEVKNINAKILPGAIKYLVFKTGKNLWRLNQEIKKLSSYSNRKPISERDIDMIVTRHTESNIFSFTDALSRRKTKEAISLLQDLVLEGESISYIFFMLVRQFRILIQMKDLVNRGEKEISKILGMNPYIIKNIIKQIDNFSMNELKNIYSILLEIDIGIKTGKIRLTTNDTREFEQYIENFIYKITNKI